MSQVLTPVRLSFRRSRTLVALTLVALVAVTVLVVTDRSSSRSVTASERQLRGGFLQPLTEAGLAIDVLDACHYSRVSADETDALAAGAGWHFSVKIAVSASPETVARILREKTGAVIVDDRDPILVQQYRGEPNRGWNGGISQADGGSLVTVVKNNIANERSIHSDRVATDLPRDSSKLIATSKQSSEDVRMEIVRQVVVFDAADLAAESAFWAGMLGGRVVTDSRWHSVIDGDGRWVVGVQLAPDHVPPDWPDGSEQQVHLDLHVNDPASAHAEAIALGARLLQAADDLTAAEGHQVYADPAGHPFCLGWGHPSDDAIRRYLREG